MHTHALGGMTRTQIYRQHKGGTSHPGTFVMRNRSNAHGFSPPARKRKRRYVLQRFLKAAQRVESKASMDNAHASPSPPPTACVEPANSANELKVVEVFGLELLPKHRHSTTGKVSRSHLSDSKAHFVVYTQQTTPTDIVAVLFSHVTTQPTYGHRLQPNFDLRQQSVARLELLFAATVELLNLPVKHDPQNSQQATATGVITQFTHTHSELGRLPQEYSSNTNSHKKRTCSSDGMMASPTSMNTLLRNRWPRK